MRAEHISELAKLGLSPDQIAGVLRWKAELDEPRLARARGSAKAYRARQKNKSSTRQFVPQECASSNVTSRHMTVTVNAGVIKRHQTSYDAPVKSLKVSRNSQRHMTLGRGEGETYKEGGEGKGALQVLLPTVEVPSEPSPPAPACPPVPQISTQQAQTKKELYDVAAKLLGPKAGAAVSKLLKLHGDSVPKVAKVFEFAGTAADPSRYVFGAIQRQKDFLNREELDRKQIAEWRPSGPDFPKRDYSHPRTPYYVISKADRAKKLWLGDERVEREMAMHYEANGYVDGR